jgi:hypothetical protein
MGAHMVPPPSPPPVSKGLMLTMRTRGEHEVNRRQLCPCGCEWFSFVNCGNRMMHAWRRNRGCKWLHIEGIDAISSQWQNMRTKHVYK